MYSFGPGAASNVIELADGFTGSGWKKRAREMRPGQEPPVG